jgi:putative SOS response-associated peptidase YedK
MCGRFTRMYTWQELVALYHLSVPAMTNFQPRYSICPTDAIDVVVRGGDDRALVPMRWGLIPGWWKKPLKEMRLATFNARSDSVADKPMFRDSFKKRRCLHSRVWLLRMGDDREGEATVLLQQRWLLSDWE